MPLHPADRGFFILRMPRAERIPYDINLPARVQEPEHRLLHANMRFATRDDDFHAVQTLQKTRLAARIEIHFMRQDGMIRRKLRNSPAQAFRVLLRENRSEER